MTAVALPTDIGPADAVVRLLDWGSDMVPLIGGPAQRMEFLGSRHALDVEMPQMKPEPRGRIWVNRLKMGKTARVLWELPQLDFKAGSPGVPKVKTNTSGGTSLPLKGLTPNYVVREGQFFSIIHSGRRYLHSSNAQAIADSSGDVTLTVTPMLRTAVSVNDVVEIAVPMIEGILSGDEVAWNLSVARTIGLSFSITEAE